MFDPSSTTDTRFRPRRRTAPRPVGPHQRMGEGHHQRAHRLGQRVDPRPRRGPRRQARGQLGIEIASVGQ